MCAVLVSGGVDSSVCAALLAAALSPEKIFGLHIDSGFMRLASFSRRRRRRRDETVCLIVRLNESGNVQSALKSIGINLQVSN